MAYETCRRVHSTVGVPYGVPVAADVEVGNARHHRAASSDPRPVRPAGWGPVPVVACLVAAGQLLWYVVELLQGYFFQDDYVLLYLGGTRPLWELATSGYNGHLQPGTFAVSWVLAHVAPLSWPATVLPVIGMQVAVAVLAWRVLDRLFGQRWAVLVPFTMIVWSPLTFGLTFWWAYALQLLPVQVAMLGALNAHLARIERPTTWRTAQVLLFTAFGLAFWEKAALVPVVLFGLTLALTAGGPRERLVDAARRHSALWSAGVALLVGYAVLHVVEAPADESYLPTVGQFATQGRQLVGDGLVPALFGGPWSGDWVGVRSLGPQDGWVLGITWTLAVLAVAVGLWVGRTRAAFAWLTLAVHLVVAVALTAFTRLGGEWGSIIGTDPRYIADAVPVAVVCGALALLRPRIGSGQTVPAPDRPARVYVVAPQGLLRRARVGVALVLTAAYVVGAVLSIVGALPEQRHRFARDYVDNVRAAQTLEPDLVLYDTAVPSEMLIALFGDQPMGSRVLRGLDLRVDQPSDDMRILDISGIPREMVLVNQVPARPGPAEGCGYLLDSDAVRVPLSSNVGGDRLVLQIGYYVQTSSTGTVSTPNQNFEVRFEAGLNRLYVVADGPFDELLLDAGDKVCVTDLVVGQPLPRLG